MQHAWQPAAEAAALAEGIRRQPHLEDVARAHVLHAGLQVARSCARVCSSQRAGGGQAGWARARGAGWQQASVMRMARTRHTECMHGRRPTDAGTSSLHTKHSSSPGRSFRATASAGLACSVVRCGRGAVVTGRRARGSPPRCRSRPSRALPSPTQPCLPKCRSQCQAGRQARSLCSPCKRRGHTPVAVRARRPCADPTAIENCALRSATAQVMT